MPEYVLTELVAPPDAWSVEITGINNLGEACGLVYTNEAIRAARWSGGVTILDTSARDARRRSSAGPARASRRALLAGRLSLRSVATATPEVPLQHPEGECTHGASRRATFARGHRPTVISPLSTGGRAQLVQPVDVA